MNIADKGTCPICRTNTFTGTLHRLADHLEREHTTHELIYQIANSAITEAKTHMEGPYVAYETHCPACKTGDQT